MRTAEPPSLRASGAPTQPSAHRTSSSLTSNVSAYTNRKSLLTLGLILILDLHGSLACEVDGERGEAIDANKNSAYWTWRKSRMPRSRGVRKTKK